jgi:hypothetical protein
LLLAGSVLGCEPKLVVGEWSEGGGGFGSGGGSSCDPSEASAGGAGNDEPPAALAVPWSTGFEQGFCDYAAPDGYCYALGAASNDIVTEPVRSGRQAAAFSLNLSSEGDQTRCVRRGELPKAAYYSAYFFIPEAPRMAANWNLMHFRSPPFRGLWDVSLDLADDGSLSVSVFDHLRMRRLPGTGVPPVPVGAWVQLEAYLLRATDETGEFAVYQDGELALSLSDLSTDEGSADEWYVGNLAVALTPAENTVYVDDIAIREAP